MPATLYLRRDNSYPAKHLQPILFHKLSSLLVNFTASPAAGGYFYIAIFL